MFKNLLIRWKISLIIILIVVLFMGAVSSSIYYSTQQMVSKQIGEKIEFIKNAQKNTIRNVINRVNDEVRFYAQKETIFVTKYDSDVRSGGISEDGKFDFDDNYYYIFLLKSLEIAEQNKINEHYIYSYITTSQGVVIADSRIKNEEDVPSYVGYQLSRERYSSSQIDDIHSDGEQKYFLVQSPIQSRDEKSVVGYYTIAVDINIFSQNIAPIHDELLEEEYLVNDEGIILNHPRVDLIGTKEQDAWFHDLITKGLSGEERREQGRYFIVERIDEAWGFYLIVTIPLQALNEPVVRIRRLVTILSLVALILIFFSSYYLITKVLNPLNNLLFGFERLQEGELAEEIKIEEAQLPEDEIGILSRAFNLMVEVFRNIIGKLMKISLNIDEASNMLQLSSKQLVNASDSVASMIVDVTNGSEEQNKSIININARTKKLSDMIMNLDQSNQVIKNSAAQMTLASERGETEIQRVSSQMESIKVSTDELSDEIDNLNAVMSEISDITVIINSVANQTNILAINASIEASRAGEAGRGFAVIAQKIRDLAIESAESTGRIKELIDAIKEKTENASSKMKIGAEEIENGKAQVDAAREAFEKINLSIQEVVTHLRTTEGIVKDINIDAQEIATHIDHIAAISEQNSARTREVAAVSEEQTAFAAEMVNLAGNLATMAEELNSLINRFKV